MEKIKKYIHIGMTLLIPILTVALILTVKSRGKIEKRWKESTENVKSYSELFSNSENKNRGFKLTIDQLQYFNDSILRELNETRESLKVKDAKLKSLQYLSSTFIKYDTLIIKDTLFKDPQIQVDTVLSDEWYSIRIGLKYPSTITVNPMFRSVKHIVVSSRRETINPPKKFFLFRWFQKKHTVLNIDVVEKNPYMKEQNSRYIEIIK
jgi:hypothetical protein